jgi:hypothetical protein
MSFSPLLAAATFIKSKIVKSSTIKAKTSTGIWIKRPNELRFEIDPTDRSERVKWLWDPERPCRAKSLGVRKRHTRIK